MKLRGTFVAAVALSLAILSGGCGVACASTVYDFSGSLGSLGSVTGTFTYNTSNDTISSFSFNLPTLPYPVSTITSNNGYVADISSTIFQFQEYGSYDEFLTLEFSSLPGSVIGGGLTQYPNESGSQADFASVFSTGSAVAATPIPPSWTLFFGSLLVFGAFCRRIMPKAQMPLEVSIV